MSIMLHGMRARRPGYWMLSVMAGLAMPAVGEEAVSEPPIWSTIVVGRQGEAERLATIDLQRCLAQVTGVVPAVTAESAWRAKPVPAVLLLASFAPALEAVGEQGYALSNSIVDGVEVVVAGGATSEGAVNAVYGLLRELGFGFYLGSEAVPASLPPRLRNGRVVRKPVLAIRGVLPWYNFFNSPTVWDPQDHRAFVDQLIRMGANFVGFHTYDTEPFAAYEESGKMKWGARLLNTRAPTWGTQPTPTSRFAFGIDRLFADESFGAASTQTGDDPEEAIRREQNIMRDALDYAHRRGLRTCLGFEIGGDPTNPADRDVFLKRIHHVLNKYPSLDYVWIWQPETQGAQGFRQSYNQHILGSTLDPKSPLCLYGRARREVFRRIVERTAGEPPFFQNNEEGKIARAIEGARLEQFARLACRAMSRRESPPKLVISGWGGDERILSAEYYDGLDKLLPPDVVFASLDHIWPRPRVDAIYHDLPPQRQRWPIPWLELDGDQWHPQPYVHVYQEMMRDVHRGGSQGLLGIHWRTREVEETFAYTIEYAWNPDLTAEQFFAGLAARCYGPRIAGEMASIHAELDRMGYRWIGGSGQVECGTFGWGPGEPAKVDQLRRIRERIVGLLPDAAQGRARLRWVLDRIDWVLAFQEAQLAAVKARDLLAAAKSAEPSRAVEMAAEALALLDNGAMARALQAYVARVSTRGEYGVLATINTKAVPAWRELRSECLKILNRPDATEPAVAWDPAPRIILPRFPGAATEGRDLEFQPIALGGQPAWIHYRIVGRKEWTSRPMETVKGWVQRAVIAADAVAQPGLEIGFSFAQDPGKEMDFGPVAVTVFPALSAQAGARPVLPFAGQIELRPTVQAGKATPVEVTWNDAPEADYFVVYRDGERVADTAVAFFPDELPQATASYVVEAWRDGKAVARSEPVTFAP